MMLVTKDNTYRFELHDEPPFNSPLNEGEYTFDTVFKRDGVVVHRSWIHAKDGGEYTEKAIRIMLVFLKNQNHLRKLNGLWYLFKGNEMIDYRGYIYEDAMSRLRGGKR
jgi:hypothetical protein